MEWADDVAIVQDESADLPNPDRGTSGRAVFRACDQRRTDLYREVDQELASKARCVKAACKRTVIGQAEGMKVPRVCPIFVWTNGNAPFTSLSSPPLSFGSALMRASHFGARGCFLGGDSWG